MRLHPVSTLLRTLPLTALLLAPGLLHALPTDRDQPVQVNADSARFNEKTGIATYTGAVVIRQGTLEIRADEIVITTDRNGGVSTVVSKGKPARYQQQTDPKKGVVTAESERIDYDARNEIITLAGNARLKQDGASFQGSTITYNSQTQQVDAKGDSKNRVQLILPPSARDSVPRDGKDNRKDSKK